MICQRMVTALSVVVSSLLVSGASVNDSGTGRAEDEAKTEKQTRKLSLEVAPTTLAIL